jgi:hypothetical protein
VESLLLEALKSIENADLRRKIEQAFADEVEKKKKSEKEYERESEEESVGEEETEESRSKPADEAEMLEKIKQVRKNMQKC